MPLITAMRYSRNMSSPAFKEMISVARRPSKPFQAILVWKYSRFARSREDSIVFKTILRKNGVQVISINEPSEDTPVGRLMEGIIESLDEFYSDNLGEEVTRGMRESVSRGFYISINPPYGYSKIKASDGNKVRTKLELNPAQAPTALRIFKSILAGKGVIEVVRELNSQGIPSPRGRTWTKSTMYTILTNEIYTGTLVWGRNSKRGLEPVKAEGACPAIIDKKTFDAVQQLMASRAPKVVHPRVVSSRFLLSGLARCGFCGRALTGQDAKSGKFSYYVCGSLTKKGAGSCQFKYLNAQKFERAVIDEIKKSILTKDNLNELAKMATEEWNESLAGFRQEIDSIEDSIKDTQCRLSNTMRLRQGKSDYLTWQLELKSFEHARRSCSPGKVKSSVSMRSIAMRSWIRKISWSMWRT